MTSKTILASVFDTQKLVVQAADVRSFSFCKENTSKEDCDIPTCFQRDSYKDEVIVYFYIIITSGLLLIALTKPYIERWWRRTNPPHTYTSMPNS
ncbi:unnamed protein product [Rhizophagus irregularis]|nr:unnamed protein product [Rhizophagus irregularis]CAB4421962.1 unnamed protein product [Rhizophagus irregularis]